MKQLIVLITAILILTGCSGITDCGILKEGQGGGFVATQDTTKEQIAQGDRVRTCFENGLKTCRPTTFILQEGTDELSIQMKYTILEKKNTDCLYSVKIIKTMTGTEILLNKEMTCRVPFGTDSISGMDSRNCEGSLKDAMQLKLK